MVVEKSDPIFHTERRLGRQLTPSEKRLIGLAEQILDGEHQDKTPASKTE